MGFVVFVVRWCVILGAFQSAVSFEWNTILPLVNLDRVRSQVSKKAGATHRKYIVAKTALKSMVTTGVETPDIRLVQKDHSKSPLTHPLLSTAPMDTSDAESFFVTGWMEFYMWGSNYDSVYKALDEADKLFDSHHYNTSLPTLLLLHDKCGNARDETMVKIIQAMKMRHYDVNFNIFLLDYKQYMCDTYSTTLGSFKLGLPPQGKNISTRIGDFLYKGIEKKKLRANQLHILGIGVSTYTAGFISKHVRHLSGHRIGSILGLDPPVLLRRRHLSRKNAISIHIYHTYKYLPLVRPRTGLGSADFVFGGARKHPKCRFSVYSSCYKWFSVQLFVSTLLYPKLFPGRWCPDYKKFSLNFCDVNEYSYVSFPPDSKTKGTFQMKIKYEFPYGEGLDGIDEKEKEGEEEEGGEPLDVAKLSNQEYMHAVEKELSGVRTKLMTCLKGLKSPSGAMRCLMIVQPAVRRLEKRGLIRKVAACLESDQSPSGKLCKYENRMKMEFDLPF